MDVITIKKGANYFRSLLRRWGGFERVQIIFSKNGSLWDNLYLLMFIIEKWVIYAVAAAMLWGASYAASGPILRSGMSPLIFYFYYSLVGAVMAFVLLISRGKVGSVLLPLRELGTLRGWFVFSLLAASLGALMTYMAIGAKNPTLASLIEISYPFFVVLFSWLFFRDLQLNLMTFVGGFLVVSGISIILLYAK